MADLQSAALDQARLRADVGVVDQVTSEQRRAMTCVACAVGFEASSSSVVNRIGLYSEVRIDHPIRRLRLRPLV